MSGRQANLPLGILALLLFSLVAPLVVAPASALALSADFSVHPDDPLTNQDVQFSATDPTAISWNWVFDSDAECGDTNEQEVTCSFPHAGPRSVTLTVSDGVGADTTTQKIEIGNRPPSASIAAIPSDPVAGEPVTFVSTSTDPDGSIKRQAWDLDGDGQFDDSSAVYVQKTFPRAGSYTIGLMVTDDSNATAVSQISVIVGDVAGGLIVEGSGQPPGSASALRLMTPFPIVRMSGLVRRRGIKLRLLSASAPAGASVAFRCHGRGCPFHRRSRIVKAPKGTATSGSLGTVRLHRFGHRLLRAGAVVKVLVSSPGSIGKYTRFRIRRGRVPARDDSCLLPSSKEPISCPSA
jgi:PKD repeat protein